MKNISLVEAKFIRGKVKSKCTTLWVSTDHVIKELILNKIHLELDGKPIICNFKNSSYWWLLTNMSLMICNRNIMTRYKLIDIERVEINNLLDGKVEKKDYSNLELHINGQHVQLDLEKGTWPILYDIFKFIISSSTRV